MAKDRVHVVLGEQKSDPLLAGDAGCGRISAARSRGAMPAGRLVHQKQARLGGQRHGQFHALDVAIGELADRRSASLRIPTRSSRSSALAR